MGSASEFDVYEILAHPLRRLLLEKLHERPGSSFTELMKATGENTGSLSFHLTKLEPLVSQDKGKMYHLNQSGENAYSVIRQMDSLETAQSRVESVGPQANLAKDEKTIMSSDKVRPLGQDHAVGGLTKSSLHHIGATLTNRRLLLSSWRFFRPAEIQLNTVKLVRLRKDIHIPFTKGNSKGRSIEVTFSDTSGRLHWVRFMPPDVEKWEREIRDACSEVSNSLP